MSTWVSLRNEVLSMDTQRALSVDNCIQHTFELEKVRELVYFLLPYLGKILIGDEVDKEVH